MFLEKTVTPQSDFWKYIIGTLIIIVAMVIGQIPFMIAIAAKSVSTGEPFPIDETGMLRFLSPNVSLFFLLMSFAVGLLAVLLVVKYLHQQSVLSLTTAREKVDWKRVFFSFFLWSIFVIGSTSMLYFTNPENFTFNFKPTPFAILAAIAIIMVPLQTSAEEYIFRGYLMQGFASLVRNKWFPLLVTSFLFGMLHISNPEVQKLGNIVLIYYIGTGLFLGITTLMDDGMELALGFHAANNLVAALLVTSDWTAFQTHSILKDISEPSAGFEILVPVCIIFPLLLLIFSRKYKWNNWKEKLTGKIESNIVKPL